MVRSTFESVADRVRRFPRAAAQAAMAAMTSVSSPVPSTPTAAPARRQRCERETPVNSRYFLRSMRR